MSASNTNHLSSPAAVASAVAPRHAALPHRFRRVFLGPSPVPASIAASAALDIGQDVRVQRPTALLTMATSEALVVTVPGAKREREIEVAQARRLYRGSVVSYDMLRRADGDGDGDDEEEEEEDEERAEEQGDGTLNAQQLNGDTTPPNQPRLPVRPAAKGRARRLGREASAASFASQVTFASAQSVGGAAFNEVALHPRMTSSSTPAEAAMAHTPQRRSILVSEDDATPVGQRNLASRRARLASVSCDGTLASDFDRTPRANRAQASLSVMGRSSSPTPHSRRDVGSDTEPSSRGRRADRASHPHISLPPTRDASVGVTSMTDSDIASPQRGQGRGREALGAMRRPPSHARMSRNASLSGSMSAAMAVTAVAKQRTASSAKDKLRPVMLRRRSGTRATAAAAAAEDESLPWSSARRHPREFSRQSKLSRASTQGSFVTRATDGSFGAQGGVRAKIRKVLGMKPLLVDGGHSRTASGRPAGRRAATRGPSVSSFGFGNGTDAHSGTDVGDGLRGLRPKIGGGVIPGKIGTSGGGTKWVGQSFEVGKRIHETLELARAFCAEEGDEDRSDETQGGAEEEKEGLEDGVVGPTSSTAPIEEQSEEVSAAKPSLPVLDIPQSPAENEVQPLSQPSFRGGNRLLPVPSSRSGRTALASPMSETGTESRAGGWSDVMSFTTAQSIAMSSSIASPGEERGQDQASASASARSGSPTPVPESRMDSVRAKMARAGAEVKEAFDKVAHGMSAGQIRTAGSSDTQLPRGSDETERIVRDASPRAEAYSASSDLPTPTEAESLASPLSEPATVETPTPEAMPLSEDDPAQRAALGTARQETAQDDGRIPLVRPEPVKKSVQFGATAAKMVAAASADSHNVSSSGDETPSGAGTPAPPSVVLSRPSSTMAVEAASPAQPEITPRTELKRDRMLVKVAWTPSPETARPFDEPASRKYAMNADDWKEYTLVLRMGRLELWEDASWASKALGHASRLRLRVVIPLRSSATALSLYSPIDRIFSIQYSQSAVETGKGLLDFRRSSTNVLFFDARHRTLALEWMWEIWTELGGSLPPTIDLHIPVLEVRLRLPVPPSAAMGLCGMTDASSTVAGWSGRGIASKRLAASKSTSEDYSSIAPSERGLMDDVMDLIRARDDWRELLDHLDAAGLKLGLAWRSGARLDWVAWERGHHGNEQDHAAVLHGLMLKEARQPLSLELRAATHYPTTVNTAEGKRLEEPPSVEGFLWRVKPVSGALTRLYASTHDGHIFISRPSRAYAPPRHLAVSPEAGELIAEAAEEMADGQAPPPSAATTGRSQAARRSAPTRRPEITVASTLAEIEAAAQHQHAREKRRIASQIAAADGYCDLRDIQLVRTVDRGWTWRPSIDGIDEALDTPANETSPDEGNDDGSPRELDFGGEEALAAASDRQAMRRKRQFEIVMSNGKTTRFEAYSQSVAREWVRRLAALSVYWKRREKLDAIDAMRVSGYDPAWLHRKMRCEDKGGDVAASAGAGRGHNPSPAHLEAIAPILGNVWNWCVIEGCRGIMKSGRLFEKRKAFTTFSSRHYILVQGRLLSYRLVTSQRTARSRQNAGIFHRRQDLVVPLRDAYIYSGKLTEDMLQNGRSEGAGALSGKGSGSAANFTDRHRLPRVYRDGLVSEDDDEDCTFVLRYPAERGAGSAEPASSSTPPHRAPTSSLVLRARSKLERDLWVRAIGTEIERLAALDPAREKRLREYGKTPYVR